MLGERDNTEFTLATIDIGESLESELLWVTGGMIAQVTMRLTIREVYTRKYSGLNQKKRPRGLIDAYSIHMSWYIVHAYSNMHAPGIDPYIPRFCLHVHSLLCEVLLSSTPAAGDAQPSAAKRDTDYFLGVSGIE